MMRYTKTLAASALLLFGAAACGDLQVDNINDPDADRALATAGDVESLIGGSWSNWWSMNASYNGMGPGLSTMAFQHSAYPANFGMVNFSTIPRTSVTNSVTNPDYAQFHNPFTWGYRAISGANDGIRAIKGGLKLEEEARALAFGRFVQGISHGYLAMLYEKGPIADETLDLDVIPEYVGYQELAEAALGFLDEAIAIASANDFTIPVTWMRTPSETSSDELVRVAHSYKARIRAAVARTPDERRNVNWTQVVADIDKGITEDFGFQMNYPTIWHSALYYTLLGGWSQMNYMVLGMADQSGAYQEWMSLPASQRHPNLPNHGPFLMQTPDERFPQGTTLDEQVANPGTRFIIPVNSDGDPIISDQWGQAGRGTWRWSYYRDARDPDVADVGFVVDLTMVEMDLLRAEAAYYANDYGTVADIINKTRTAAGLNATDASGTNTSCVPKLPNGDCGDLWEMLKWEKRLEAGHNAGSMMASWYFDGRGWGDLMEGTILHFPVPANSADIDQLPIDQPEGPDYEAPVGTYGY